MGTLCVKDTQGPGELVDLEENVRHAKVIVVGPTFVGKTTIIQKITESASNIEQTSTSKIMSKDYHVKINMCPQKLRLNIWDTPGGDHFADLN